MMGQKGWLDEKEPVSAARPLKRLDYAHRFVGWALCTSFRLPDLTKCSMDCEVPCFPILSTQATSYRTVSANEAGIVVAQEHMEPEETKQRSIQPIEPISAK